MRCDRKLSFDTVEQAERTARVVAGLRAGETGTVPVRIYECGRCGKLHFTSKTESETRVSRATTVATIEVAPLFQPQDAAAVVDPCVSCGATGAKFEFRGAKYHRECRRKVVRALPEAERQAVYDTWHREGMERAAAKRAGKEAA